VLPSVIFKAIRKSPYALSEDALQFASQFVRLAKFVPVFNLKTGTRSLRFKYVTLAKDVPVKGTVDVDPLIEPLRLVNEPLEYSWITHASETMTTVSNPELELTPKANLGSNPKEALTVLNTGDLLTLPSSNLTFLAKLKAFKGSE
jgi:hypothetical protein